MSFWEAQKEVLKNIHITLFHTMTLTTCIDLQKKTKTHLIVVQVTCALYSMYICQNVISERQRNYIL